MEAILPIDSTLTPYYAKMIVHHLKQEQPQKQGTIALIDLLERKLNNLHLTGGVVPLTSEEVTTLKPVITEITQAFFLMSRILKPVTP